MPNTSSTKPSIEEGTQWIARDSRRNTGIITITKVFAMADALGPAEVYYKRGGASHEYMTLLRNWHRRFKPLDRLA